ncbi:DUF4129 domain-containing transglutaminase family protein [Enterococcus sp. LJL120]
MVKSRSIFVNGEKLKADGLLAFLAYLSVATAFTVFLQAYSLSDNFFAFTFFAVVAAMLLLLNKVWLKSLLVLAALFFGYHHFFPYNLPLGITWLIRFKDGLDQGVEQLINSGAYIGEILAMLLLLLLSILLLVLFIHFKIFFFGYSLMIGYLLMTSLYHPGLNFTLQALIIASCGILSVFLKNNYWQGKYKLTLLLTGIGLTLVIFLVAEYLPSTGIRNSLMLTTANFRTQLNATGFYDFVGSQGTASVSRMGFSEDDSSLGGPLLDDNAEIFTARQASSHYWRVESKDFYSGAGWFATEAENATYVDPTNLSVIDYDYQRTYAEAQTIELSYTSQASYLALPYGANTIAISNPGAAAYVQEEIRRVDVQNLAAPIAATINWQDFSYDASDLENVYVQTPTDTAVDYLQLPENLPSRVGELATQVTTDVYGLYNQVLAVEDYLKNSSTFRYSKVDAAVIEEGQDYVDQFLFETQVGYCDNFSSSMVVMLRTLGIPARWTKGFAPGSRSRDGEEYLYTVTNNNAHSWVEVYFSGFGWLPFEPTPSFSNPDRPTITEEAETPESSAEATPSASSSSTQATTSTTSSQVSSEESTEETAAASQRNYTDLVYLVAALLLASLAALIISVNWLLIRLRFVLSKPQALLEGYPLILKKAEKKVPREPSETLIAYAQRFAKETQLTDFAVVTEAYEAALYGNGVEKTSPEVRQLLWQVAKKLTSPRKNKE